MRAEIGRLAAGIGSRNMWRAFFLGIGVYLIIAGAECLAVDRVSWRAAAEPAPAVIPFGKPAAQKAKDFPAPWVPWSLLSTGAVVCLYSFTIPQRMGGGSEGLPSESITQLLHAHHPEKPLFSRQITAFYAGPSTRSRPPDHSRTLLSLDSERPIIDN